MGDKNTFLNNNNLRIDDWTTLTGSLLTPSLAAKLLAQHVDVDLEINIRIVLVLPEVQARNVVHRLTG